MSFTDYTQAVKLGKKDYQSKLINGESPTLEVLDDILHTLKSYKEVSLGLAEIPLDQIVGTKTAARSTAFSGNQRGSQRAKDHHRQKDQSVEQGCRFDPVFQRVAAQPDNAAEY